jgi:hypothetical protein
MIRALLVSALLLTAGVAGCFPKNGATATAQAPRNMLSRDEMIQAGYPDAFATVQSLRPQWLQAKGATSIRASETVKVYLDGTLLGGPDQLRQITTRSITSIRYLSGLEASERWGLDHGAGAIVVVTRAT